MSWLSTYFYQLVVIDNLVNSYRAVREPNETKIVHRLHREYALAVLKNMLLTQLIIAQNHMPRAGAKYKVQIEECTAHHPEVLWF